MTEAEWLACTDPQEMLNFSRGKVSPRKLRLFAAACCRRIWPLLKDRRCRRAVEVSERLADGRASEEEWEQASDLMVLATQDVRNEADKGPVSAAFFSITARGPTEITDLLRVPAAASRGAGERAAQSCLLRDIFNPFYSQTAVSIWLHGNGNNVPELARTIYLERRFSDLPFLADALEEAGCTDAALFDHCRQPGEHVRGCWVVDLLLGKS